MPLAPGARLDRYEVLQRVAWGGMGEVWLGRLAGKHGFEKLVAIKTMLPEIASDERLRTMFLDEARLASRVAHANVAQVLDLGEAGDLLYLVMEWVDGESLESLSQRFERAGGSLPLGPALRIVADGCAGLHAAHEARGTDGLGLGLVHRDVSPQNILVSDQGVAKVIDFGIARARDRLGADTRSGAKGKPSYMAPEQERGSRVDRRADIWSMGAVLHRVLVGEPPFLEQEAFDAYVDGRTPFPDLPVNRVPPAVAPIVARALAARPADRFATAAEMQAATEAAATRAGARATTADVASVLGALTPARAPGETTAADTDMTTMPASSARILVVSANAQVRARIVEALGEGEGVEEASGGIAALRKLATTDAVVVDGDATAPDAGSLVISLRSAAATAGATCRFIVITRDRSAARAFGRRGFAVCLDEDRAQLGPALRALVR
jgi:serine/threonine-protein kinase